MGRRPTPTATLRLNRAYRNNEHGDRVEIDAAIPSCPDWLGGKAKTEWRRLVKTLGDQGILSLVDRGVLAEHCHAYDMWVTASKAVARDGLTIKTQRGEIMENPMGNAMWKAFDRVLKTATELGFTPVSRCRIKTSNPKAMSELDAFVSRKKRKA